MWVTPEGNEKYLFDLLITIPPNWAAAEQFLDETKLTPREITRVALAYAGECFCEAGDYAYERNIPHPASIIPGLHSTYIYNIVEFLLHYGLEPNGIYEEDNIMEALRYVDNEFLAADALGLLLEHGGNYDLFTGSGCEPFFQSLDFDVYFDAIEQEDRQRYAAMVHCWMVAIGYGACCNGDKRSLFKEYGSSTQFDLQKLKNHRNYYFGVTHLEKGFAISIYDKETLWEVARII